MEEEDAEEPWESKLPLMVPLEETRPLVPLVRSRRQLWGLFGGDDDEDYEDEAEPLEEGSGVEPGVLCFCLISLHMTSFCLSLFLCRFISISICLNFLLISFTLFMAVIFYFHFGVAKISDFSPVCYFSFAFFSFSVFF